MKLMKILNIFKRNDMLKVFIIRYLLMPSIKIANGKLVNPLAFKLILKGSSNVEIILENPRIVTSKLEFCSVTLAEHYLSSRDKYGQPKEFIDYLSANFKEVDIDSDKGTFQATEVTARFKNQLKRLIDAHILMEMYDKGHLKL